MGNCRCKNVGPLCWELRAGKGSPFKPGVGQNIVIHASVTARNFFLISNFLDQSTSFFSKTSCKFFLALSVANTCSCVCTQNKWGHPVFCHKWLVQVPMLSPCIGELQVQKLKSHLVRTQSLNILPLKPGVGQYITTHATLTARDFFLAYLYSSGPFICIFFYQNLSRFFLYWLWLAHGSCVGPQNKIGHPAGCKFLCWVPAQYQ